MVAVHSYDDPYRMLAIALLARYDMEQIGRLLTNDSFIKTCIRHEVQYGMDINGPFCDCVVDQTIRDDLIAWKHELATFSEVIFRRLDLERCRREVRALCEELEVQPIFPDTE